MYYASSKDCDSLKSAGDRFLYDWNMNVNKTTGISFNIGCSTEIYNNSQLNFQKISTADSSKLAQDIQCGEYTNETYSGGMQILSNGALHSKRIKKTKLNGKIHKQIAHCNVERRRRGLINEKMVKLQGLLFPGRTKCKKSDVLTKAIDCIASMKEDYDRISKVEEAVSKLLEENKVLASQVQMLESLMNSSAYIPSNNMVNVHYKGTTSGASTVSYQLGNCSSAQHLQNKAVSMEYEATQINRYVDELLLA